MSSMAAVKSLPVGNDSTAGNPRAFLRGPVKKLCYALFHCDPSQRPPFALELGFDDRSAASIAECPDIPDAVEKLKGYCQKEGIERSERFALLYPIYLEAMGTDDEDTMHQVAWLIKEKADQNQWAFGRIGGYTGNTVDSFR